MQKIVQFLKYTFFGKKYTSKKSTSKIAIENATPLEELVPDEDYSQSKMISREQVVNRLMIPIHWILAIVCLGSFTVIVVNALNERAIPEQINNAFLMTLSWFGGALTTYLRIEENRK